MFLFLLYFFIFGAAGRTSPNPNALEDILKRTNVSTSIQEDARLDVPRLLKKYGYPGETHKVTTDDGYILEVHRIRGGRLQANVELSANISRPVVFLMHGLLSSSADWVVPGPQKGLGYKLADAGYDVWMGNARGNYYSRGHKKIRPTSKKFWEFSWHEIGHYDLAAFIDYITAVTGVSQLHYIGYSQGTTAFFVLASTRPEYNAKFKSVQALAPVAFINNAKSPVIKALAPHVKVLEKLASLIGMDEFAPKEGFLSQAGSKLCKESGIYPLICSNILFLIGGFNADQLNETMLPVYMSHTPAGSSARQFAHYAQGMNSGLFREFDMGTIKNLHRYGQINPPNYRLDKVTAPVALHYGDNDWLADPTDVKRLYSELPRTIGLFRVPFARFNHLDFIFAKDAYSFVYKRIINIVKMAN